MWWAALLLPDTNGDNTSAPEAVAALGTWALQFTPRVAEVEGAVLMELEASLRLFGGRAALRERVRESAAAEFGVQRIGWAPTGLAALAFARAGAEGVDPEASLSRALDRLPMDTLGAVAPHRGTLARLGCRTLGDVRRLPRAGLGRRFDTALLAAFDQAYGQCPEPQHWLAPPETFLARLELMSRVEDAPALMHGAHRLLLRLCGWLAARHRGVTAFALRWAHDAMRSRAAGEGGELVIRTRTPTRRIEHLARLLAEHLARTELLAPAGDLELEALGTQALAPPSGSLLPDDGTADVALDETLERIAARLGPQRVLRPVPLDDHRLEHMQRWQPVGEPLPRARPAIPAPDHTPQPSWVLPRPLRLPVRGHRPVYRGVLQLIAGPHRVEGGWWDRAADGAAHRHAQRDYFVALDEQAGVLWVFQERLADEGGAWYLHGVF
ncbi:MAG: DNA polymerase Y family protein [Hydrogenophaga sp.]|uniref:Y-family DNA polymerase n=1 Tax=Hydrogenophaga sp. TaxID=1904254 RepID=UPI0016B702A2|nr:DNA polymerase Y family protein [Hydrogenophaga sp.]NIM41930.1 DNA polymerase Y family protein [Hydrogenophaga sp.]NIN27233.1 DNA polymerase Y family protein [Hydrogenophaga sp.]NIN31934.1 DNA polymerase Y family protein [Hydrogenophaga sp.]NIN56327.1 DNA polymerase Y family protein [Hydrogenophaga sp.]NIO52307.1 DNA polymerase Y family protein [Hydrogenophaga sp.]